MDHSVENTTSDTSFDLLSFPTARLGFRSEDALKTKYFCLGQRSSMISILSFPSFPSLAYLRIAMRRNNRLDGGVLFRGIGQWIMDLPAIIRSVAIKPGYFTRCLRQHRFDLRSIIGFGFGQSFRGDLSRIGIDAQMQFSPGASSGPAVLTSFPLPMQFQFGAVDEEVTRLASKPDGQVYRQAFLPTRQRSVIRYTQRHVHHIQQQLDKLLDLAQRQAEQLAKGQRRFNDQIRIQKLGTALSRFGVSPARQSFFTQQHGQVTALDQGLVIGCPVFDSINRRFPHRLLGEKRGFFAGKPASNLT